MKTIQKMVKDLIAVGLSECEIAVAIGCTQPTVNRIRHGSDTSYSYGKALEALYLERCGGDFFCEDAA